MTSYSFQLSAIHITFYILSKQIHFHRHFRLHLSILYKSQFLQSKYQVFARNLHEANTNITLYGKKYNKKTKNTCESENLTIYY